MTSSPERDPGSTRARTESQERSCRLNSRSRFSRASWLALLCVAAGSSGAADPEPPHPGWKLVWEDDFEREQLGDDWAVCRGEAEVRDGRLFLSGKGATALVDRGFRPDVLLEFVAEANPDLPPCDLSAALGSSMFWGYGYLLAFGGNNNQLNQILGGGARKVDNDPPFLIEHGEKYRCVAIKEGRRLAYHVNGVQLLESSDPDPVGGPGFDRVGLVTWNGMYVDRVRVYERETPAEGGPVILRALPEAGYRWERRRLSLEGSAGDAASDAVKRGVAAYNRREYKAALDAFDSERSPTLLGVVGRAYVLGDLAFEESPGGQARLAALADRVAGAAEGAEARKARDFALAAEWFRRITIRSRDRRAVTRLLAAGPENNPFYHKADLYRARYHYASAVEGADSRRVAEALEIFKRLRGIWPDVLALREYSGERVPWGEELIRPEASGPDWARYLEEVFVRQHAILRWWFTVRQAPDGQLGGGWGDDVEILRSWAPVACISMAGETAVAGIERLAEGVWDHVLRDGFSPGIGDVEHSAEPSADALPPMMLLRYGDPRFVEYNLRSAKTIREKFLGINERGHLQFRSSEFGTDGVNTHPRAGGDTGYHARAMRHFLWLAWYGIPEAREVYLAWCDTWRAATLDAAGTKPPGFVPASVFFPSGGIQPPDGRPWYDPAAHYYGFPGITAKIHDSFLSAYWLSGSRRFLDPVETMLRLATTGPLRQHDGTLPPDASDNLLAHVAHQASREVLSVHRLLTGSRVYDDHLMARGRPFQRFLVHGDRKEYTARLQRLAEGLRYNWVRRTSEVLQTDRAGLAGAEDVLGAYTGAVRDFTDAGAPLVGVTWDTRDLHFAALVEESTPVRLRVRVHCFGEGRKQVGLRPWMLVPGRYELSIGEPVVDPRGGPERFAWREVTEVEHRHRGSAMPVALTAGRPFVVDLRLKRRIRRPAVLPDPAVAARDVRHVGEDLSVSVHNLGGAAAGPFHIRLETRPLESSDGEWKPLGTVRIEELAAIRDLSPVVRTVTVPCPGADGPRMLRVVLDPEDAVEEICEANNHVVIRDAAAAGGTPASGR